jgi:hypothetical protein
MHTRSHVAGCTRTGFSLHYRAMRILLLTLVALGALAGSALAGKQVKYIGIHPVAKAHGGGFCYIEGPHVHTYAADNVQYRDHRGHKHFIGDPVAYGYDGPKHSYKGNHPIEIDAYADVNIPAPQVQAGIRVGEPSPQANIRVGEPRPDIRVGEPSPHRHTEYCYLDGPHYHYFTPPESPDFKVVGGVYFYVGTPPPVYVQARPAMMKINAMYTPIVYARPVVTVEAPVGWIGARAEFIAPVVVAPTVVVPAPSVRVDIGIGVPGVIIHDHRHRGRGHYKYKKHKKWR